jgi:16S rRNA (uracil1498-N3)-methyltransferase
MKQSMNAYLPQLSDMTDFKKYIAGSKTFAGQKFIAHCYDAVTNTNKPHLKHVYSPKANVLILIGPEGDFSIDEVKYALENGFQEISLGTSRLRTETAALAACLTVHILNS